MELKFEKMDNLAIFTDKEIILSSDTSEPEREFINNILEKINQAERPYSFFFNLILEWEGDGDFQNRAKTHAEGNKIIFKEGKRDSISSRSITGLVFRRMEFILEDFDDFLNARARKESLTEYFFTLNGELGVLEKNHQVDYSFLELLNENDIDTKQIEVALEVLESKIFVKVEKKKNYSKEGAFDYKVFGKKGEEEKITDLLNNLLYSLKNGRDYVYKSLFEKGIHVNDNTFWYEHRYNYPNVLSELRSYDTERLFENAGITTKTVIEDGVKYLDVATVEYDDHCLLYSHDDEEFLKEVAKKIEEFEDIFSGLSNIEIIEAAYNHLKKKKKRKEKKDVKKIAEKVSADLSERW